MLNADLTLHYSKSTSSGPFFQEYTREKCVFQFLQFIFEPLITDINAKVDFMISRMKRAYQTSFFKKNN